MFGLDQWLLLRPWALLSWSIPLLVLLASLRKSEPLERWTGTFELWEEGVAGGSASRRWRIPLGRWLLIFALFLAGLAWAGPRRPAGEPAPRFTVVVDRSPSLYLAHPSGGTRLDAALARVERWRQERGLEELTWIAPERGRELRREGARIPAGWLRAPRGALSAPRAARWDRAGVLLVTDRVPEPTPRFAGWSASGGSAVHGPLARGVNREWAWTEQGFLVRAPSGPLGSVAAAAELPAPLLELLALWSAERGLAMESAGPATRLEFETVDGSPGASLRVGRDGWWAEARPLRPGIERSPGLEPWLVAPSGEVLIGWYPGRILVALEQLGEPAGDPAAFAVSCGRLFDRALLPADGCVAAAERSDAGAADWRAPRAAANPLEADPPQRPLETSLAALAAVLSALALVVSAGGRRV